MQREHEDGISFEELLASYNEPEPEGYEVEIPASGVGRLLGRYHEIGATALALYGAAAQPTPNDLVILSNRRAECSRGLPVVVVDGIAYGPGDLPGVTLQLIPRFAEPARRAGFQVEEIPVGQY